MPQVRTMGKNFKSDKNVELDEISPLFSNGYRNNRKLTSDDQIYNAVYLTQSPMGQISQCVDSYFRSVSCNYTMIDLFGSKDKLSDELCNILNKAMNQYGYLIARVLITDIDPPEKLKKL